jgi:hypothetical protein
VRTGRHGIQVLVCKCYEYMQFGRCGMDTMGMARSGRRSLLIVGHMYIRNRADSEIYQVIGRIRPDWPGCWDYACILASKEVLAPFGVVNKILP